MWKKGKKRKMKLMGVKNDDIFFGVI